MLPLECHFLNKNAFISAVGHMPQAVKHFSLRRKPKAAALKADLVHKSKEAQQKAKSGSGPGGGGSGASIPVRKSTMPRRMTADYKGGMHGRDGGGGFRSLHSRHPSMAPGRHAHAHHHGGPPHAPGTRKPGESGGVKLLDITEQPMGYQQAKKRKREQELEEREKQEKEKRERKEQEQKEQQMRKSRAAAAAAASAAERENAAPNARGGAMPGVGGKDSSGTPDYATGLGGTLNPPTPGGGGLPPPSYAPPTPTPLQPPQLAPPPPSLPTRPAAPAQIQVPAPVAQSSAPPTAVLAAAAAAGPRRAAPSYAPPRPTVVTTAVVGPPSAAAASLAAARPPPPGVSLPTAPVPPQQQQQRQIIPAGLTSLEPLPQVAVRSMPST